VFGFGSKKSVVQPFQVDVHSHLVPGIDDGVQTVDEALTLLAQFQAMGYRHIITTPHIMGDYYRNTPETVLGGLQQVKQALNENSQLSITISAAAEYYLDEYLLELVTGKAELLLFGQKYLLFETGFLNQPALMHEFVFNVQSRGIKPVLAHPERYIWLQDFPEKIEELHNRGVLFQINLTSLTGYYSKTAKKLAEKLLEGNYVSFAGSDCHNNKHMGVLQEALLTKKTLKLLHKATLLNNTLHHT